MSHEGPKSGPIAFVDLEGVLCPEMWPHLGEHFGLAELMATTRQVPDYQALMDVRISALRRHGITITRLRGALDRLDLLFGAPTFIKRLAEIAEVVIVSDSFRAMNSRFVKELGVSRVLCHDFVLDQDDFVVSYRYWNDLRGKDRCIPACAADADRCVALGDALNDLTLLRAVGRGALFRPSPATQAAAPDLPWISSYAEAYSIFSHYLEQRSLRTGAPA